MSVAEAIAKISAREFAEWRAYNIIEPIGQYRADLQAATIVAAIMGLSNPWRFLDFSMGEKSDDEKKMARDQIFSAFRRMKK